MDSQGPSLLPSPRHSIPKIREFWIDRPHLTERLHGNIGSGLAVIQASAGYGKTTLLAQFAAETEKLSGFRPCWVSLDSTSAMSAAFAVQVAEAFDPEASISHLPASAAVADLKAFMARAVQSMRARTDDPALLILDNTQEITGSEEALELIEWLLGYLPEGYETVLSGRKQLPLAGKDGGLAAGKNLWLGATDLAFRTVEIQSLRTILDSDSPSVENIEAATEGWPIGVVGAVRGTVSLDASTRVRNAGAWTKYVADQVWDSVPLQLQKPLATLAVATEIDRGLAEHLLGPGAWAELEAWLDPHSWLVEVLSDGNFRLNPLLRRFLIESPSFSDAEAVLSTAEFAAQRFQQSGRFVDALEVALATQHRALVARLLEDGCADELLRGSFAVLRRAFDTLPEEQIKARPILRAYRARVLAETGDVGKALDEVATLLDEQPRRDNVTINSYLARIRALRFAGRIEEMGPAFKEVRAITEVNNAHLIAELQFHEASYKVAADSDFPAAEELLTHVIDTAVDAGAIELELLARSTLGQVHAQRGQVPRAIDELTAAARGWRNLGGCANVGWVLNNLGMAHLLGGDFETAGTVLRDAVAEAIATGNARSQAYSTASLADAEVALGQFGAAKAHYQQALKTCTEEAPDISLATLTVVGLSAASLGQGDIEHADFLNERAAQLAEDTGVPFDMASVMQQQSAIFARAGDTDQATILAHESKLTFERCDSMPKVRFASYRWALCMFNQGRKEASTAELAELSNRTQEPWMMGTLKPLVAEAPMFAQWAAGRPDISAMLSDFLSRESMAQAVPRETDERRAAPASHSIHALSLGRVAVSVDGEPLRAKAWQSARAREMFFLLLNNRDGLRKAEAVDQLTPGMTAERQNSTFHSNLYRVRNALYGKQSVVEDGGVYVLDPDADICWDVSKFQQHVAAARALPAYSAERADAYERALGLYAGPFATEFFGDWAEALRSKLAREKITALHGLAAFFAANNEHEEAIKYLARVLREDGQNEEAAFQLITLKAQAGETISALSFCDAFANQLREEMGVPLPERFSLLRSKIASGIAL